MPSLRTASIRAKLFAILMTTTSSALVVTAVSMTVFELRSYREAMSREVVTLAQVIAANTSSALAAGDRPAAEEILRASAAPPEILSVCLYDRSHALFASYVRPGQPLQCPALAKGAGLERRPAGITVHLPVHQRGVEVGTLRVFSHLGELRRRVNLHMIILIIVLVVSALVAVLVATRLQRIVSAPILELGRTAKTVSENQNYSLRAGKQSEDEIGAAVDAFNQMLDRIEKADADLRQAIGLKVASEDKLRALNATLEGRIADRTAALEERAAELKRSNQELESFAYVASHDLQEPLRAVASYAQLLARQMDGQLSEDGKVYIAYVLEGAARMRALISALLDYSRVGRSPPALRPTAVETVVDEALADLSPTIAEAGARVQRGPLPRLQVDPVQLGQLFRNLIGNGIKFRGEQPPVIAISAEERPGEGEWRFAVSDNGVGIQPKYFDRIFVIFQRLHGRERPGTGIGLAICKKIVERHGGQIWVESQPGQGSTFYFTLPTA